MDFNSSTKIKCTISNDDLQLKFRQFGAMPPKLDNIHVIRMFNIQLHISFRGLTIFAKAIINWNTQHSIAKDKNKKKAKQDETQMFKV